MSDNGTEQQISALPTEGRSSGSGAYPILPSIKPDSHV